ncbi:MAG TPA: hypothetical protein VJU81_19565 [Methylomirabilota bacterium]|nr:hypothetical protein [Methylomirabilota bacterium]
MQNIITKGKILDAVSAYTQANERVIGELLELGSATAREGVKSYIELQSAALEAARELPFPGLPQADMVDELRRDPLVWYRKGLQALADGTQRATKLVETNAQIIARTAERFQASAERTAKEIEATGNAYVNRMREIYSR